MSEPKELPSNSENFTLHDFIEVSGETLDERVAAFSKTVREYSEKGWTIYSREVIGPPGPRVQVRDPLTQQIQTMIMMGSNDYLGLIHHPEVVQAVIRTAQEHGVGMGGPPLLNGMSSLHRELERELASLKHAEDALIYSSGFQANLGWTSALLRSGDYVLYDELNHASFFDGLSAVKATRKVKAYSFKHNDIFDLIRLLAFTRKNKSPNGQIFVIVEGVYSMDGDLAPLPEIGEICETYGATLIVDDAHGTGVLGENGGGTAEHLGVSSQVHLNLGTFSKSFGVTGGFIAGKKPVIDYLRFFSRSYLFSAHLPQTIVSAVIAGCKILKEKPELRAQLRKNVEYFTGELKKMGLDVQSESAIVPIRIPQGVDLRALNKLLHQRKLFVNAIEYPAVALDQQRIRASLMATHTREDLSEALEILNQSARDVGLL